ncbi:nicotinamide N-methyltransferase-like [Ambystoma mexicanum]|uniref:nicotinamide N-methyltransferase-like n=1 Tax=Ambystoma mexicanum TaxID=8296 RepID=UPI0037E7CA8C
MANMSCWTSLYGDWFDAERILFEYFTMGSGGFHDAVAQPLQQVDRVVNSIPLKGDLLIAYGISTGTHLLFPACNNFKEIIVVDFLDRNIQLIEKWQKKDPKTFSWKRAIECLYENEEEREKWFEREEKTRTIIKQVVRAEFTEEAMHAPPSLPQADCLFSPFFLNHLCPTKEAFATSVKNMSSMLKVGGHMLMHVFIGATFFMQGNFKLPMFCIDEESVKKVVSKSGFVILETEMNKRVNPKFSTFDFTAIMFLFACKERDV